MVDRQLSPILSLTTCCSPGLCHLLVELCRLYYADSHQEESKPCAEDLNHPTTNPVWEECVGSIIGPEDICAGPGIGVCSALCIYANRPRPNNQNARGLGANKDTRYH